MSVSYRQNVAKAVCNILEKNGLADVNRITFGVKFIEYLNAWTPFALGIYNLRFFFCGSCLEGLHFLYKNLGIKGDMDIVVVFKNSIADLTKETRDDPELHQLLIQPSEGNPGYVLLLKLGKDGRTNDLFSEVTSWDEDHLYLSNKISHDVISRLFEEGNSQLRRPGNPVATGFHYQGPSAAMGLRGFTLESTNGFEIEKTDIVPAIPCSEWPPEANEWLTRSRECGWPPEDVITKIKQAGSYIVPKGCEGSPQQEIEWRYSFSHSEKHLIWSLSSVQLKCYAILKLLRLYVFSELHRDIISSYIIKTSVFWTVEEIGQDYWTPPMLLDCTERCLIRVRNWVTKDFCPNYIMRECNLMRNRYTAIEKDQVLETLTDLIYNLERRVLNLLPVIKELQNNSLETLARENIISRHTVNSTMTTILQSLMLNATFEILYGYVASANSDVQTICSQLSAEIQKYLLSLASDGTSGFGLDVVLTAKIQLLSVMQQMSDPARQGNVKVMKAIASLRETCQTINGEMFLVNKLYLATVHLSMGYVQGALEEVQTVDEYFKKHQYINFDYKKLIYQLFGLNNDDFNIIRKIFKLMESAHIQEPSASNVYINDAHFALAESQLLPKPIQFEVILRAKVDNVTDKLPLGFYISTTSIDPLVFSCFLQFWCHRQLENNIEQIDAMKALQKRCEDQMTTNKDISWNLLGFCNTTVGQQQAAFNAYFQALREKPTNKACLFYVAFLLKELIRKE